MKKRKEGDKMEETRTEKGIVNWENLKRTAPERYKLLAQGYEHDAWIEMFNTLAEVSGITKETLNLIGFKRFFTKVEKWGYYEYLRRTALNQSEPDGLFWNGKD
jgi:hypothetical protein